MWELEVCVHYPVYEPIYLLIRSTTNALLSGSRVIWHALVCVCGRHSSL